MTETINKILLSPATNNTPSSPECLQGLKASLQGKRVTTKTRILVRNTRKPDAYYWVKAIIPNKDALIVSPQTIIEFTKRTIDHSQGENPFSLFVAEAYPSDEGRGVVRMELSQMLEHNIKRGDKVQLFSAHNPAWRLGAIVLPSKHIDIGLNLLRMDYNFRGNLQIVVGQSVQIKALPQVAQAEQLIMKPTSDRIRLLVKPGVLKKRLVRHLVTRGQILIIKGKIRLLPPKKYQDNKNLKPKVQISDLSLVVDSTRPDGIVVVNQNTQIIVKERI